MNRATTMGKRIFRHYQDYPATWDPSAFSTWEHKARALFDTLGARGKG